MLLGPLKRGLRAILFFVEQQIFMVTLKSSLSLPSGIKIMGSKKKKKILGKVMCGVHIFTK